MNADTAALYQQAQQSFAAADLARAQALCDEAITLEPANVELRNLRGLIAVRQSDFREAVTQFEAALAAEPRAHVIHNNLGAVFLELNDLERAAASFSGAIRCFPGYAVAHKNLGQVHQRRGDFAGAEQCFAEALKQSPSYAAAHISWADLLSESGDLPNAATHLREALALQDSPEAKIRLASTLDSMGHHARAAELYREIEAQQPNYPGLQNNLGQTLMQLSEVGAAMAAFNKAMAEPAAGPIPANSMGNACSKIGRPEEAIRYFRQSLEIRPDYATAHSNLLLNLNYVGTPQVEAFAEARRFAERQFAGLPSPQSGFANEPDPQRRLRIGFVSGDFRSHSVAYFLLPLLEALDRSRFEILCYSNNPRTDAITEQFQSLADDWIPIRGKPDAVVAQRIRDARTDILLDLTGHTAGNRLAVFAHKPAPVQISWLGYPNTTGLDAMDYRLTDAFADPPDSGVDDFYSETLYRLPKGFLCYAEDSRSCSVAAPPESRNGYVTFGSFNMLAKVTPDVVAAWAQVLQAVPGSRFLVKGQALDHEITREQLQSRFAAHGIGPERLNLMGMVSKEEHYAVYGDVDIALDTFPYNGTTTTCEALWMGVPVITLRGEVHAARVGASLLHFAELDDLVASDRESYIRLARELAADAGRRKVLRSRLRVQLQASALMDKDGFARQMEAAWRDMWTDWCTRQS